MVAVSPLTTLWQWMMSANADFLFGRGVLTSDGIFASLMAYLTRLHK